MRIFCVSQGSSLRLLHNLVERLVAEGNATLVGHYVADRAFFGRFAEQAALHLASYPILKEWEIYAAGRNRWPQSSEIVEWEKRLGPNSLWPAIICDRRAINGRLAKVKQDYAPQYSLEQLQGIAVEVAERLWQAFEETRPDVVLGFVPVTVGDYLAHVVARARGIPHLHLKSTKISNFVTLTSDLLEGHPHIRRRYRDFALGSAVPNAATAAAAHAYLTNALQGRVSYEGSLRPAQTRVSWRNYLRLARNLPRALLRDLRTRQQAALPDPQMVPATGAAWQRDAARGFRSRAVERIMAPRYLLDLSAQRYVFFPLNSEPEVALSLYSRFTLNQIEVARNIAQSLPMDALLVIKEHPRSWGLRPSGYYRRLLEIPNVYFVPTHVPTTAIIAQSVATVVISGFAAFEAILQHVPVITLGHTLYDVLPQTMIRRVHDFEHFAPALHELTEQYVFDGAAIERFVAAVMTESAPVDLYNVLLGKAGRELGTEAGIMRDADQLATLAGYVGHRLTLEYDVAAAV